jgi:hypothetical protein
LGYDSFILYGFIVIIHFGRKNINSVLFIRSIFEIMDIFFSFLPHLDVLVAWVVVLQQQQQMMEMRSCERVLIAAVAVVLVEVQVVEVQPQQGSLCGKEQGVA